MRLLEKVLSLTIRPSRRLLRSYFKFDKWHVSTLYDKKYALDIVRHLNSRPAAERTAAVEIGCGLGDILRHLRYRQRTGFDNDRDALRAARFLSRLRGQTRVDYDYFEFPASPLNGTSDVILMVNWIHHVPPDLLKKKLGGYFEHHLRPGGEIVIDTVQDKEYKFNHDIRFLTLGLPATIERLGEYQRQREIWLIKKI
ncbi:MAG TPA: class I SAM-dependent methyltransferase [Puia sp.]